MNKKVKTIMRKKKKEKKLCKAPNSLAKLTSQTKREIFFEHITHEATTTPLTSNSFK